MYSMTDSLQPVAGAGESPRQDEENECDNQENGIKHRGLSNLNFQNVVTGLPQMAGEPCFGTQPLRFAHQNQRVRR